MVSISLSLPSRERGLKCLLTGMRQGEILSLPSRERGLKSWLATLERRASSVAPFTGAWIEITGEAVGLLLYHVAPFTGAWIEMLTTAMTSS